MSSYSSPSPQGDSKATGAWSVAIAAQAGGTNNDGNATDSAGNVKVDFAWGNFPIQPNDERTENALSNFGGTSGDTAWSSTTYATAARLSLGDISAPSGSNVIANKSIRSVHEIVESDYSSFPAYSLGVAKYNVTQVDGDGTTVTFQCQNFYNGGETVDITGCGSFNLTSATIATAKRDYFTVTNSTTGSLININNGIVTLSTGASASDGAYVSGTPYISVPSVLGLTTALALDSLKDSGYANGDITTASAATNTATQPTRINVTAVDTATVYVSGGTSTWPVGTKVTIATGTGIPAALVGTWSVTGGSGSTLVITGSGWTVADTGSITPGTKLTGATGTIKTQSTAAGAATIALGATITVTPWA